MVRVALINPGRDANYAVQEPLNLGFIASYLEQNNIKVIIIDELAGQNVKKELRKFKPDIVGITATTPLAIDAYRVAKMCRDMNILTVMGGVHASIMPDEALQHVDVVVKGEGEFAMLDIIQNKITSGIISKPYIRNLDEMPPPARHLMQMNFYLRTKDRLPGTYLYFVPLHSKVAAILTSRNCPYDCIFCHNSFRGMPFRANSPERVITEIKELVETYGVQAVFFIEDNFFANKDRVKKICELMKREKFNLIWGANARVDGINKELLELVREVGCRQITFGFESGSQNTLNTLNKRTVVEQNKRAIELCNEVGLIPQGTVMIGNPNETVEDIKETQTFIKNCDIKSVGVCITTPYPGTKLWDWCKENNLIPKEFVWSDFNHNSGMISASNKISLKQLKQLQKETENIIMERQKLRFSSVVYMGFKNPKMAIKILVQPSKMITIGKRLLLRVRIK